MRRLIDPMLHVLANKEPCSNSKCVRENISFSSFCHWSCKAAAVHSCNDAQIARTSNAEKLSRKQRKTPHLCSIKSNIRDMSVVEGNQQTNAVVHDRNETMINLDEREETNAQPEKQTICKMLVQWICQFTVLVSLTTIWLTDLPFTIGLVEDREQGWPKWYEFYSHIDITRKVDVGTKEETLVSYDDLLDLPEFKKCSNSKDLNGMEMVCNLPFCNCVNLNQFNNRCFVGLNRF